MIIGIGGRMCAGKTSMCNAIGQYLDQHRIPWYQLNFADSLKSIDMQIWGDGVKNRKRLQQLGAAIRAIDPNAWVNIVRRSYSERPFDKYVLLIGDVRYDNELDFIHQYGVSIYIDVPLDVRIQRHVDLYGYAPSAEALADTSEQLSSDKFKIRVSYQDPEWSQKQIPISIINNITSNPVLSTYVDKPPGKE